MRVRVVRVERACVWSACVCAACGVCVRRPAGRAARCKGRGRPAPAHTSTHAPTRLKNETATPKPVNPIKPNENSVLKRTNFRRPADAFVLLHLERRHLPEWVRAMVAVALGVGPRQPLPPLLLQEPGDHPTAQIGALSPLPLGRHLASRPASRFW